MCAYDVFTACNINQNYFYVQALIFAYLNLGCIEAWIYNLIVWWHAAWYNACYYIILYAIFANSYRYFPIAILRCLFWAKRYVTKVVLIPASV